MKVTTITTPDYDCPEVDGFITITLKTDTEASSIRFGHGEPEDNYLFRGLSGAYNIAPMLKSAYDAGKNGETFELVEKKGIE